FEFSNCYDQSSTQAEIFGQEIRDLVLEVFNGVTSSIFTFGCTGSGKTYTLQGVPADPGIVPRTAKEIFDHIHRLEKLDGLSPSVQPVAPQHIVSISCFEIWKDKVWDLLSESTSSKDLGRGDLSIRETSEGHIFIPNLCHHPVKNLKDFEKLYSRVTKYRATSSTKLNHLSSRSHAILNIHVTQIRDGIKYEGKCVLIDLAGSENNKNTGNEHSKERMKESVEINQSLLALRKVVKALDSGDTRIPYRDSKLTRILSDSLGGTSSALVICNITPNPSQYRDTINTLTFGSYSRNVENKVVHREKEYRRSLFFFFFFFF
ncbi:P-loop containing nucleoside triphosphate hydrolase protein, partial [Phakopsora pachyrhizi]